MSHTLRSERKVNFVINTVKIPSFDLSFVNRAEDHLEETLRNIEELSEKVAEQDTTIKSLRKQVLWIGNAMRMNLK